MIVTPCPFVKVCLIANNKCYDRNVLECPIFQEYVRLVLLHLRRFMGVGEELEVGPFRVRKLGQGEIRVEVTE